MLTSSTSSKSTRVICLAPSEASCNATCRPMAPTPITPIARPSSRSRGTSPSWRLNRLWLERFTGHLQSLRVVKRVIKRVVHPVVVQPLVQSPRTAVRFQELSLLLSRLEQALFGDRCQIFLLPVLLLRGRHGPGEIDLHGEHQVAPRTGIQGQPGI